MSLVMYGDVLRSGDGRHRSRTKRVVASVVCRMVSQRRASCGRGWALCAICQTITILDLYLG